MAQITVNFTFHSGVTRHLFRNVRLSGSWNGWKQTSMTLSLDETACDAFFAGVQFDSSQPGAFSTGA
jgi:1,4-alpha-glucan branching enzyme